MGKSPGKWIKTVLFGKKASRSNISKGRHASKATTEKETWVAAKEPITDLPVDPPSVSEPNTGTTYSKEEDLVEKASSSDFPCDEGDTLCEIHVADKQETTTTGAPDDPERTRQEQAAIKVQAAFRGYLARRAFWALRGIIRLQALVRGYLVRRQAIATLHCLQGIVRFQALVRGRNAAGFVGPKKGSLRRTLVTGSGSFDGSVLIKLSANVFVRKLLKSSTTTLPLRLPYGLEEPNSAWNWLERWSHLCETVTQLKKVSDPEDQLTQLKKVTDSEDQLTQLKKVTDSEDQLTPNQGQSKRTKRRVTAAVVENDTTHSTTESEKPKRQFRKIGNQLADPIREHPQNELEKVTAVVVENDTTRSTSESEKPKRQLRKTGNQLAGPIREHPQSELEKVKRSLRKVSNSVIESNDQLDVEREKPTHTLKASTDQASDIPDSITCDSVEKLTKNIAVETERSSSSPRKSLNSPPNIPDTSICDATENSAVSMSTEHDAITSSVPLASDEAVDVLHKDLPSPDLQLSKNIAKDESIVVPNAVAATQETQTKHNNQKTTRRRASFPAKLENPENGLQNTPSPVLPSYMAATKSAKAKLRGQESPRVGEDVAENDGFIRRHSLSSPKTGKLISVSPRTQKMIQANGKGGNKNDKSLLSSRDGGGWRR